MITSYFLILLFAFAVNATLSWQDMKNYEAYYYDRITKSPQLLTRSDIALSKDVENFVYWQRAMVEYPTLLEDMEKDRIVSWYNHLGKLQEGFQTNSVSFTLTALRILRQILEVMPNETNLLNLAPTIFEMINRPHANIDVTADALTLYRALSQMAHNSEKSPLLDKQGAQLLINRLKGSEYTKFMRGKIFEIFKYESRGCLEDLEKERQFLYKQVEDTTKEFYESTFSEKFERIDKLLNSWAHLVAAMTGNPSSLMESYLSKISGFAKAGMSLNALNYLLDFTSEVGYSKPNSICSHYDLLLLMQYLEEHDQIRIFISIFNMDKNQLQEEHALHFLKLMTYGNKAVALKAKDIIMNKFPQMFKIHPEPLFKVLRQFIADETDLLFILNSVNKEMITADQVKLIFEKLPKTPITNFQDVLTFLLNLPNKLQEALSKKENHDFAINVLDILNQQDKQFILEGYQLIAKCYLPWAMDADQARAFISRLMVIDEQDMPFVVKTILQAIKTPSRAPELLKDIEFPTSNLDKFFSSSTTAFLLSNEDYFSLSVAYIYCLLEKTSLESDALIISDSIDIMNFNDRLLFDIFQTAISSPYVELRIFAVSLAKKFVDGDRMRIYSQRIYDELVQNLELSFHPVTDFKLKTKRDIVLDPSLKYSEITSIISKLNKLRAILHELLMEFSTIIMSLLADLRSKWDEFKKLDISSMMKSTLSLMQAKSSREETNDYSKLFSSYLDLAETELYTKGELSHIDALSKQIVEVSKAIYIKDIVVVRTIYLSSKLIGSTIDAESAKRLINIIEAKINDPSEVAEYAITCLQETHSIVTLSQVEVDRLLKIASKADGELRVEKILLALLEAKGLTLPVGTLYEIIQVAEKLNSEKVVQKLIQEIRLSKFDTEESIDVKSAIELIAHISRKPEIKGEVFEAVINVLKASNWDLEISLTGLRIIQNESTSDAQMGQELISLMQSLETLEDDCKIEIMALGMQILRASFNNFKNSITKDQVQFIDRTVAAAQSLNISNIMEKHQENVLSPTLSIDIAETSSSSTDTAEESSTSMGTTETSSTSADKSDANPSEGQGDSKETEERLNMLTIFKDVIVVNGKEILAEFIKPITSTALLGPTISTQNPVISSTNVVIAPSAVVTPALEITKENKLNLGIAVGVPIGIIAFLATSFVLVRKCRMNKNSIAGYRMWARK